MKESTYKKHCLMVDEYFNNGFNGTQAYIKFNPKCSEETARTEFPRILVNPRIEEYIQSKYKKASNIASITHSELLAELKRWLNADATEFINVSPEAIKMLPSEIRKLVTGFTHIKTTTGNGKNKVTVEKVSLKFVNKAQAAQMVAKHIGFFGEHNYQKAIPLSDLTPQERKQKLDEYRKRLKVNPQQSAQEEE